MKREKKIQIKQIFGAKLLSKSVFFVNSRKSLSSSFFKKCVFNFKKFSKKISEKLS